ncbi:MAG: hypothetical protein WBA74_15325 [Cyclobacteriaceae bacterium]
MNDYVVGKIHGVVQSCLSISFLWYISQLWYLHNFTEVDIYFSYPDWAIFIFMILSLVGINMGVAVFSNRISFRTGYVLLIAMLLFGLILDEVLLR